MKSSNQKYIKFATAAILAAISFFSAKVAFAHFLQTDGPIAVILHADPDDDPIIGQQAFLSFEITNNQKPFNPAACDCAIVISKGQERLLQTPLTAANLASSIFVFKIPFTFQEKAIYNIVVTGRPKTPGNFPNFRVQYDLRVDRENSLSGSASHSGMTDSPHLLHAILLLIVFFIVILKVIWEKWKSMIKKTIRAKQ